MVNTFSQDRDNVNVYVFFQRLRNALSHSGNGQIHFFPNENGQDITHLYFYDENFPDDFGRQKLFLVKIHILNELPQLVTAFDNIILSILNTNNLPYDLNHIRDNIENCTGIDISDWSDE